MGIYLPIQKSKHLAIKMPIYSSRFFHQIGRGGENAYFGIFRYGIRQTEFFCLLLPDAVVPASQGQTPAWAFHTAHCMEFTEESAIKQKNIQWLLGKHLVNESEEH